MSKYKVLLLTMLIHTCLFNLFNAQLTKPLTKSKTESFLTDNPFLKQEFQGKLKRIIDDFPQNFSSLKGSKRQSEDSFFGFIDNDLKYDAKLKIENASDVYIKNKNGKYSFYVEFKTSEIAKATTYYNNLKEAVAKGKFKCGSLDLAEIHENIGGYEVNSAKFKPIENNESYKHFVLSVLNVESSDVIEETGKVGSVYVISLNIH